METLFLIALLTLITIILIFFYREYVKPKLFFSLNSIPIRTSEFNDEKVFVFQIYVGNTKKPQLLRETVQNCRGLIQFYDFTTCYPIFEESIPIRWSNFENPFVKLDSPVDGINFEIDKNKDAKSKINIKAGDRIPIDILINKLGSSQAFFWHDELNNQGSVYPHWELPDGRYLVSVVVFTYVGNFTGIFDIRTSSNPEKFKLLEASKKDKELIKENISYKKIDSALIFLPQNLTPPA